MFCKNKVQNCTKLNISNKSHGSSEFRPCLFAIFTCQSAHVRNFPWFWSVTHNTGKEVLTRKPSFPQMKMLHKLCLYFVLIICSYRVLRYWLRNSRNSNDRRKGRLEYSDVELNLDEAETESRSKVLNPTFTFFVKLVIAVTVFIFARQSHLQKQSTKNRCVSQLI